MKVLLVFISFVLFYNDSTTIKEGVITYEQKVNLHRRLPNPEMKNMLPEFQTSQVQLFFSATESLYRPVEEEEEDTEMSNGNMRMRFRRPMTVIYRNFENNQKLEQMEFMGKNYLVEGTPKQLPWKVTGEMEKIAGYDCMKATLKDSVRQEARTVVAWFTNDIPVSAGPERFGALPGMILKVDINDGESIYTAVKIEGKTLKDSDIEAPTKGKKMTEEEFRKAMDEEMKKMGGQGNRMIIRN